MLNLRWLVCLCAVLWCNAVWAAEPDVAEVRESALRYAGLDSDLDPWSARARWRNLVPEVSATVGWVEDTDEGTAFTEYLSRDSAGDLLFDSARTGNDHSAKQRLHYSVRASIDLRGLIFDPAELHATREARQRSDRRQLLVTLVHDTYFERQALLSEEEDGDSNAQRLRVLEARLDGMTGGWFTRRIETGVNQ